MRVRTSRSRNFVTAGVRAIGRKSFRQAGFDFFGAGLMVVFFRHLGTTACCREVLKMWVNTSASCRSELARGCSQVLLLSMY